MAVVITEKKLITQGGGPTGRAKLVLSVNNDTTSFIIIPGHSDTNVTGSSGLTTLDCWGWSNQTAQKAPQIAKSFSATYDCEILTFTCASADKYDVWVEGPYVGS